MSNMKTKLLIVEDGQEHRDILLRRLDSLPIQIEIATNKPDAKKLLRAHYFHVAILDIKLDGDAHSNNEDGMDLAKHIHESGDPTGVIMLSGFGTVRRTRDSILQFGVIDFLDKADYTKSQLLAAVENALAYAKSNFEEKFVDSFDKQNFFLAENLMKTERLWGSNGKTDFEGILNELLRPLQPLRCNPSRFETIEQTNRGLVLETKYWSRRMGKGIRFVVGNASSVRRQAKPFLDMYGNDDPNFKIRSQQQIGGFYLVDPDLKVDDL